MDRKSLCDAILTLLADGIARKAIAIALILQKDHRFSRTQRTQVNSVLYGELRAAVQVDQAFNWSLRPTRVSLPAEPHGTTVGGGIDLPILVSPSLSTSAEPCPAPNASNHTQVEHARLLRTMQRLRSGLPPSECIRELTVGHDHVIRTSSALFGDRHAEARWLIVVGDYGEGKTHALSLIKDVAHSKNLATTYVCTDGSGSALNYPQRFLPNLLSTLEVPGEPLKSYRGLLDEAIRNPTRMQFIDLTIRKHLPAGRRLPPGIDDLLIKIKFHSRERTDDVGYAVEKVIQFLCGDFFRHDPSGPRSRQMAYMLLQVARDLVTEFWAQGLVMLLDEVESVYTKLGTTSRAGAYRVLAALCQSSDLAGCYSAIALTPDALRTLSSEITLLRRDDSNRMAEPVGRWAQAIERGEISILRCKALTTETRRRLATSVRDMYSRAYTSASRLAGDDSKWSDHVSQLVSSEVPVRLLVRSAIDFLDRSRYYPA